VLEKIIFRLTRDAQGYPPFDRESVWATHKDGDYYIVENAPFFTSDANLGDLVEASKIEDDLIFVRVVEESKNSLIRIICYFEEEIPNISTIMKSMGCHVEEKTKLKLIAVSVPELVDFKQIQSFLAERYDQGNLDYEEAIIRH
jgi:hypothetical protein